MILDVISARHIRDMSLNLNLRMAQRGSLIFLNIVVEAGYSTNSAI